MQQSPADCGDSGDSGARASTFDSLAARSAAMVAAHERGLSYRQIGAEFGVSRERVYQILKRAQAEVATSADAASPRVEARVQRAANFSDEAVKLGVFVVYAYARGLEVADVDADAAGGDDVAVLASSDDVAVVASALEKSGNQRVTPVALAARVAATRAAIRAGDAQALTAKEYDRVCSQLHADWGVAEGQFPWPLSQQSVAQRLGAGRWNAALLKLGFKVNSAVSARTAKRYTDTDYVLALQAYREECAGMTFAGYCAWVRNEAASGRARPSANAIRQHFGSWNSAVNAVV